MTLMNPADLPLYAAGLTMTVGVSLAGLAVSVAVGVMLAAALRSRRPYVLAPARLYVEFVRGAPLALLLFLLYYGGPQFGLVLAPTVAGVVGLGLYGAGPFAEIFRAGLNAVPRGEIEAAKMLGLSDWQAFVHIELPRALALTLPPSVGQAINLIKESSVLSVITVTELTKVAGTISAMAFTVVVPYLSIALLYWAIVEALSRLGRSLELHLARKGT